MSRMVGAYDAPELRRQVPYLPHDLSNVKAYLRNLHESLLHAGVDQVLGESR